MMKKKVLVIGAQRSGLAVSGLLSRAGKAVMLTDTNDQTAILHKMPELENAFHQLPDQVERCFGCQIDPSAIDTFEMIVASPGVPSTVPIIAAAKACGVPVISDIECAARMTQTPFVGITGTNGKTTTTALVGEIFKNSGRKTYVVGNIGDPISNYIEQAAAEDVFVCECSSFQLERCIDFHPAAAAILNLSPDHLDRHKTLENYYGAKLKITARQDESDFLIINADDAQLCDLCQNSVVQKIHFSILKPVERGAYLDDQTIKLRDGEDVDLCTLEELGIKGPHNVSNAMAAACLTYFCGVPIEVIRESLMAFKGVEHRQERFACYNGIEYINDSKGTNTDATITALKAMNKPTILLAGGYDKKEDYTELIRLIKEKVKLLILMGATASHIAASAKAQGFENYIFADDFETAVKNACDHAQAGDVVLLSPACASWGMFNNYEERGRLFKKLVESYEKKE